MEFKTFQLTNKFLSENEKFSEMIKSAKQFVINPDKDGEQLKITSAGVINIEDQVFNSYNELLNHLESSQSRWKARGGKFLFETDADLKKFNSILSQINSCVERQEEIKKQSQDSTMHNFKDLKNKAQQ